MATARPLSAGKTAKPGAPGLLGISAATSRANPFVHRKADAAKRLRRAITEAGALLIEDIADMLASCGEPVTFSSGEAAIAVGWSYIDDLETNLSSVNAALHALKSVEVARHHFGNGIANRVRLLNETSLDTARYMLEYRVSAISRAFRVAGNLVEMDGSASLCMGLFTLTYDSPDFHATVGSDQQAWIMENGTLRLISVREVTADLAAGRLVP